MGKFFQVNLKTLVFILVFLSRLASKSVNAAECSAITSLSCEVTDYTLASCDASTKICQCQTGYEPIPSGCAKSLTKPTVIFEKGRTKYVLVNKDVELTCSTSDTDLVKFEWSKDDVAVKDEANSVLKISAATAESLGSFKCTATLDGLTPVTSDPVVLELWNENIKFTPKVTDLPSSAAVGAKLNPVCHGTPHGAAYKFQIDTAQEPVTSVMFTPGAKNIKCVLPDLGVESENVLLPSVAENIVNVSITPETNLIFKTGKDIVLKCSTTPPKMYMETPENNKVLISFKQPGKQAEGYFEDYIVQSQAGRPESANISCTARYTNKEAITSDEVNVTFSDDYIQSPNLVASGSKLVSESRLVLTCGDPQVGVTYTWNKDGKLIQRQNDRIIQIGKFQSGDDGEYFCVAKKDNYEVQSQKLTVALSSRIAQPAVRSMTSVFGEHGDYELVCQCDSWTVGMTFVWTRDNTNLETSTKTFQISRASGTKHNGKYTCRASFNNLTSEVSDPFELKVEAAGKPCTKVGDCVGTGYTGVCDITPPFRCVCSSNYIKTGSVCEKSPGMSALSSAILVLATASFSQFL